MLLNDNITFHYCIMIIVIIIIIYYHHDTIMKNDNIIQ